MRRALSASELLDELPHTNSESYYMDTICHALHEQSDQLCLVNGKDRHPERARDKAYPARIQAFIKECSVGFRVSVITKARCK